jgi:hypothetical protein
LVGVVKVVVIAEPLDDVDAASFKVIGLVASSVEVEVEVIEVEYSLREK